MTEDQSIGSNSNIRTRGGFNLASTYLKSLIMNDIEIFLGDSPDELDYRTVLGILAEVKMEIYKQKFAPYSAQMKYDQETR